MQDYNIEVGDIVTYKYTFGDTIYSKIILTNDDKNYKQQQSIDGEIVLIKIERPKYEAIEAKKELLTEEEKEFLKQAVKFANYGNKGNGKIKYIKQFGYYINFHFSPHHCNAICIDKDMYFRGLTEDEEYTLLELRIGDLKMSEKDKEILNNFINKKEEKIEFNKMKAIVKLLLDMNSKLEKYNH